MLEHQRFARLQHLLDKSNVFCQFLLQRMDEQKAEELRKHEKQAKKEEKEKENESRNTQPKQVRCSSGDRFKGGTDRTCSAPPPHTPSTPLFIGHFGIILLAGLLCTVSSNKIGPYRIFKTVGKLLTSCNVWITHATHKSPCPDLI